jgi:hypothetical protein
MIYWEKSIGTQVGSTWRKILEPTNFITITSKDMLKNLMNPIPKQDPNTEFHYFNTTK